jgi:hypothetical protein
VAAAAMLPGGLGDNGQVSVKRDLRDQRPKMGAGGIALRLEGGAIFAGGLNLIFRASQFFNKAAGRLVALEGSDVVPGASLVGGECGLPLLTFRDLAVECAEGGLGVEIFDHLRHLRRGRLRLRRDAIWLGG